MVSAGQRDAHRGLSRCLPSLLLPHCFPSTHMGPWSLRSPQLLLLPKANLWPQTSSSLSCMEPCTLQPRHLPPIPQLLLPLFCCRRKGKAKQISSASFLNYAFGAASQGAREGWGKHSHPTECPKSIPSSLATLLMQSSCRGQCLAPAPSASLQTPTCPLAFLRCLNHISAGTCVTVLRRVLQR